MNELEFISKDFNSSNISKYEYTMSLIKECVRCEILPERYIYTVQVKMGEILKELVVKYTKGQSSSVTVEKAEKLIIGIWYTIDAYMISLNNFNLAIKLLKEEEISTLYEKGKKVIEEGLKNSKKLYDSVVENAIFTQLSAYNETIRDISNFFVVYNIDFEVDECDCDIDYPLTFDDWKLKGVSYIKNYIWNLYVENETCQKFDNKEINHILNCYGEIYEVDYKDLLINIYELTITNAVFAIMCNNTNLYISESDFEKLNEKLKLLNEEQLKMLISLAIDKIIEKYDLQEFEIDYIKRFEIELTKNTSYALKRDNLRNSLVITDKKKKENHKEIFIKDQNELSDEDFKNLIEEILQSDNIYEKIGLIKKNINSTKDYIDMLKSDCLFEDEYMLLFMSLGNLELSILGKYVFYGEYRMTKLDIKAILSKKVEIQYTWESYYLEYLKTLSENKLKDLENLINGKL